MVPPPGDAGSPDGRPSHHPDWRRSAKSRDHLRARTNIPDPAGAASCVPVACGCAPAAAGNGLHMARRLCRRAKTGHRKKRRETPVAEKKGGDIIAEFLVKEEIPFVFG